MFYVFVRDVIYVCIVTRGAVGARLSVNTIWSPLASTTNIDKLQITQNTSLVIANGCTPDIKSQHLHDETHILPIKRTPSTTRITDKTKITTPTHLLQLKLHYRHLYLLLSNHFVYL